jgi:hypothetical protein
VRALLSTSLVAPLLKYASGFCPIIRTMLKSATTVKSFSLKLQSRSLSREKSRIVAFLFIHVLPVVFQVILGHFFRRSWGCEHASISRRNPGDGFGAAAHEFHCQPVAHK